MQATPQRPQYLFPAGARFGPDNLVLHARGRRHSVSGFAGPLSIKTVLSGVVSWNVGGRELVVDPASFLVLNDNPIVNIMKLRAISFKVKNGAVIPGVK